MDFVSLRELESIAKLRLDNNAFQYYRSGANEEYTKKQNIVAYRKILLNPRVLRDVSEINTKWSILGHQLSFPVGIAPTAMHKLAHPLGEQIAAQIASEHGIPYTMSTLCTSSFEEIVGASGKGLRFFQLYIQKERKLTEALVKLAEQHGFKALVLTVDAPILGKREADERSKFVLPSHLKLEVLETIAKQSNVVLPSVSNKEGSGLLKFFADQLDQSLTWNDIKWLQSITKLPIVLKGIQCAQDALLAKQHGVAAVWVSNHGGRQLDTVRASVDILPEVINAVGNSMEVYVDGGIRGGSDVYKCIALGANCVFIGRPVLYGVAIGGKDGLNRVLSILKDELIQTMKLMGVTTIAQITRDGLIMKNKSNL